MSLECLVKIEFLRNLVMQIQEQVRTLAEFIYAMKFLVNLRASFTQKFIEIFKILKVGGWGGGGVFLHQSLVATMLSRNICSRMMTCSDIMWNLFTRIISWSKNKQNSFTPIFQSSKKPLINLRSFFPNVPSRRETSSQCNKRCLFFIASFS